jgi:hypothetical protein
MMMPEGLVNGMPIFEQTHDYPDQVVLDLGESGVVQNEYFLPPNFQ